MPPDPSQPENPRHTSAMPCWFALNLGGPFLYLVVSAMIQNSDASELFLPLAMACYFLIVLINIPLGFALSNGKSGTAGLIWLGSSFLGCALVFAGCMVLLLKRGL